MNRVLAFPKRLARRILRFGRSRSQSVEVGYGSAAIEGRNSENEWIRRSSYIDGWFFPDELDFLWSLAVSRPGGNVMEIGTWQGKSACVLSGACKEAFPGTRVICIDPFDMSGTPEQEAYHKLIVHGDQGTFYQFLRNARLHGFHDTVIPIAARSELVLPSLQEKFGMAFIDGTHDYQSVKHDVELTTRVLVKDGVLAIHDADGRAWPGVYKYVEQELKHSSHYEYLGIVSTLIAFRRTAVPIDSDC